MESLTLLPDDERLAWQGIVGLESTPDGTTARRLTPFARELFPSDAEDVFWQRAGMPAGVRIGFQTDSTIISGRYVPHQGLSSIDLWCDGALVATQKLGESGEFRFENLPAPSKKVELWLPHCGVFTLCDLSFDANSQLSPLADERPKWVTYGSSITHAGQAHSPSKTWAALVAQRYNLNLTSLGFGGQCHLDSMVARVMRELPADFISICAGINIHGGSLGPRTFRAALIGFVQIVREKHPTTPLALISPILSPPREGPQLSPGGWSLPLMRDEVQGAVEALQKHGDEHIFYVNGLDVVGSDEAHIMPDELHPDGDGQFVVAENFGRAVGERLFGRKRLGPHEGALYNRFF